MLRSIFLSLACLCTLGGCLHHRGWRQSATAYDATRPFVYPAATTAPAVVIAWRPVPVTTWVPVSTYTWEPYYVPIGAPK